MEQRTIRPNPFCYLIGFVVIVAGVGIAVLGAFPIMEVFQAGELRGGGAARMASGAAVVFWGMFVLTMGRIIWRGARRRGWKDRFGRLFMIIALAVVGHALQRFLTSMTFDLESLTEADLSAGYVPFLMLAIPAALLYAVGTKMAKERDDLIEVSTSINM
ncbi:hypothetical protein ACFXJ8_12995 [Nonomuraea sp. NPDC059194]|uniref:hypothetical protein n=1 Tax=Nonomuraea sp. NPDC059194 TaxID=3346764 RepID=UPI0036813173